MLPRTLPAGFVAPCLPTKTDKLPSGRVWLHEIKNDGFRSNRPQERAPRAAYSRLGNDFTHRFLREVEFWGAVVPCVRAAETPLNAT
jgi:ATP-dependent DNA ligase